MSIQTTIGLFGGTFDPLHIGHLRMALELKQELGFDDMRLLPCHQPPHRRAPGQSSELRAQMVRLALADCPQLSLDERELKRDHLSYTVDTLQGLRQELGDEVSLSWCVGMDSLVNLSSWHRWRELLEYAHLVVVARPSWQLPVSGEVAEWLQQHRAERRQLQAQPAGTVVIETLSLLPISASQIRADIAVGRSVQFLLPDTVWHYIKDNHLYD